MALKSKHKIINKKTITEEIQIEVIIYNFPLRKENEASSPTFNYQNANPMSSKNSNSRN